jgi:hypothetical protein
VRVRTRTLDALRAAGLPRVSFVKCDVEGGELLVLRGGAVLLRADLPVLLTLLGAFGGVFAFGFLGLFLGPVLLALGYTLLRQWADTDRPAAETGD